MSLLVTLPAPSLAVSRHDTSPHRVGVKVAVLPEIATLPPTAAELPP